MNIYISGINDYPNFAANHTMAIIEKYLDERFTVNSVNYPSLPFFHTCEAYYLQSILNSGQLNPTFCNVYKEDLLYFFYGKPAYKPSQLGNSGRNFMMPVCFIINYEAVSKMKRILPFDSGAFKLYKDHLHPSMKKEEFEITPSKDALNKMVNYFFKNNDDYFIGAPKPDVNFDAAHFQLEGYYSIIKSDHTQKIDDRKATIEVQVEIPILLNKANIEAIILPKALMLSPEIKKILNPLKIPLIPIINYGLAAEKYYVHVLGKVRKHLIAKHLLHDN